MDKMSMSPEELKALISEVAEEASEKSLQKMLGLFGLPNDEEGERIAKRMGESARNAAAFWDEFSLQGRRGAARIIWRAITLLFFAACGFIAIKFGWADKFVK